MEHRDPSVTYEVRTGKNISEILEAAEAWGADLDRELDRSLPQPTSRGQRGVQQ
jgi:hypothetical protein